MSEHEGARDFHVVGVGASAGGLEALERLFSRLPADTGMAFVVLQHLSPDFKSLMDELLSRRTTMPVRLAEDEMLVEPNAVYLLPPQKEMIIRGRRLLLTDKDPRHGLAMPIDLFFRSLAQDCGDRAIAIVLSGSGSDGSRGVQEVSKAGGVVFSESPDTAQFNSMPLSAIRTGVVDQVLAPEEIATALGALSRSLPLHAEPPVEDEGVDAILRLLRDEYGIDFSHYKASTVTRRIERRLALNRSLDVEAYLHQLRSDPRELNSLYEDLLIGVTRFFRDEPSFQVLEQRIIPEIVDRTKPDEQIRVWVPGCATGEEPYSIAILLHETLAARGRPVNVKILATDVHKASLEVASAGVYSEQQIAGIGRDRRDRFFTLRQNGYQISQALRESIVFAPHNLIRDAPFTRLDLITCRNLLIYFQPHAQKTVLTLFHFALKPGGFLFLGSSESPGGLLDEFDTVDEHAKIYRKQRDIALPRDLKLPLPRGGGAQRMPAGPAPRGPIVSPRLIALYDRLLDRFMPPGFLVDHDGVLVDTFGGVEGLLKVKARRPSQHLVDMLTDDLHTVVSGALHRIRRSAETVRYTGVPWPGRRTRCTIAAEPLRDAQGTVSHTVITFVEEEMSSTLPDAARATAADAGLADGVSLEPTDVRQLSLDQMNALQDELAYTRENLQAAIQELETANEELQATNEELIASNEELQSTNEELHSVNEELYTVNAEYQKKNVELQELNDDIEHLLNGTDVATMFLDRQLCIRKFTPRIAGIFRLIAHDVGRSIRTFSHDLEHPTLLEDIERVLADGVTVEAQTWDKQGRCYFLRILPHRARTKEGEKGVVLTLTDISALEQARSKLAQLSAIVESSDDAIVGQRLDGVVTSWNNGAQRLFGYAAGEVTGWHISFLLPQERRNEIGPILSEIREGRHVERLETRLVRKDGTLDSDIQAALDAEFDDHITKPPDPARLDQVLAGVPRVEPPAEPGRGIVNTGW